MSGSKYLLDTNTVLYILKGDQILANLLYQEILCVSVITEIELLSYKNITRPEEHSIKKFLTEFRKIELDSQIKEKCIEIRKLYGLKVPDSIIAATAIHLNLPLVTSDKQFKKIKELELLYNEK
jgi:predicted nucleic acid-binding protein